MLHIILAILGFAGDIGEEQTAAGCENLNPSSGVIFQTHERRYSSKPEVIRSRLYCHLKKASFLFKCFCKEPVN